LISGSVVNFTAGLGNPFTISTAGSGSPPTALAITSGTLPAGITFTNNGNGTATLNYDSSYTTPTTATLIITATDLDGDTAPQAFVVSVGPATAHHLFLGAQRSNPPVGQAINPALTVQVVDQFGNVVSSDGSTVTLGIGTNPSGGSFSGTYNVAAVNGVAT